ncbi:hypothetical protein NQ318_002270 [Aromia moschata]|uniref:Glucose-methanol-choline oxidoreductase N-terminal domain-containing protein n=1 Tax=Aromia moschata TaxID=1265417 RepID=A0AAV8Z557_9CUCU|nr:hypothetical protein NQ318_002270 [Aromia moschata]
MVPDLCNNDLPNPDLTLTVMRMQIPSLLFYMHLTQEDWNYKTEKKGNFSTGYGNTMLNYCRGKLLGGSSGINAMIYTRGNKRDYDRWAEMGNHGWEWESVLRNYKEMENLKAEELKDSTQYGREGYLGLSWYSSDEPLKDTLKEAIRTLGYPPLLEEQPLNPLGIFDSLMTIEDGMRLSSAKAFLGKVKERTNLRVALNAHVTKILIDEATMTARGVTVKVGDRTLNIYAKKEVILSAGTMNSPQLLMLSGIGPRRHLEDLEIEVLKDLPVGDNMQDHAIFLGLPYKLGRNAVTPETPTTIVDDFYNYFMHRRGSLSRIRTTNLISFINTKNDSIYPNVEIVNVLFKPSDMLLPQLAAALGFSKDVADDYLGTNKENTMVTFTPMVLNPKSRGKIRLNSKDPLEAPLIYDQYFTDEKDEDLETALEAIRFVERLVVTEPFHKHQPEPIKLNIPLCESFQV